MLSRCKENMSLMVCGTLSFDSKDAINAGVLADELVSPVTCGVTLRRIRFWDAESGRIFEFITNLTETDVPPGVLAHLYRMRWDIEKTFDEIKNKLHEKKAWASSATAKSMQATFICLTHNLMLLMEHELKQNQGVSNRAEDQRRAKRLERIKFAARKENQVVPMPIKLTQRCTVITVKMVRWIATHLWKSVSGRQASVALAALYAHL